MLFVPVTITGYWAGLRGFQHFKSASILSLSLSTLLEILQGLETFLGFADFPAVMDINDVILNTIGGIMGYLLIRAYLNRSSTDTDTTI